MRQGQKAQIGLMVMATGMLAGMAGAAGETAPVAPSGARAPTLKRIVTKAALLGEKWSGIPGIEITKKGRIYVSCFSGGETEPAPENVVYLTTSDDGGTTFAKPEKIVDVRDGARAYDPTLWLAPNGALWLVFNRSNPGAGLQGIFARTCSDPDAPQPQWGEEFRVGYEGVHSARLNKAIALSTGEWVMPAMHLPKTEKWPGRVRFQAVGISADAGRTWTLHGDVVAPGHSLENMIVERKDGSLAMYIRCTAGVIWQSESRDRGRTWSKGKATTIPNPGSRFHIRRLPDGDWLLINSPDPRKRTGMVACLSRDEGATWSRPLVLDERDNVSYPDAALAPDGSIFAVYDRERKHGGDILMAVFRKEDLPARPAGAAGPAVAQPAKIERPVSGPACSLDLGGDVKMEFVWVPPGEFQMGSPVGEQGRNNDEDQRRVTISRGFWMGKYEVTQEQWRQIMGGNPSEFSGAKHPVEMVSWSDCQQFMKKLNDAAGREASKGVENPPNRFRLPTEAEWEYACRAGTTTAFHTGDSLDPRQANFDANYPGGGRGPMPVGSFAPNAFGLHDMHGNAWERCQDWHEYKYSPGGAATDPTGPPSGVIRVMRGGSWIVGATTCRSAARAGCYPNVQDVLSGLRVVGFSAESAGNERPDSPTVPLVGR